MSGPGRAVRRQHHNAADKPFIVMREFVRPPVATYRNCELFTGPRDGNPVRSTVNGYHAIITAAISRPPGKPQGLDAVDNRRVCLGVRGVRGAQ